MIQQITLSIRFINDMWVEHETEGKWNGKPRWDWTKKRPTAFKSEGMRQKCCM